MEDGKASVLVTYRELGYVALKVLSEIESRLNTYDESHELKFVRRLKTAQMSRPAPVLENCIQLYESFFYESKFRHICLAFTLHCKSIDSSARELDKDTGHRFVFSPSHVQNIARRILPALDCIHSLGYVHTGDSLPCILFCVV